MSDVTNAAASGPSNDWRREQLAHERARRQRLAHFAQALVETTTGVVKEVVYEACGAFAERERLELLTTNQNERLRAAGDELTRLRKQVEAQNEEITKAHNGRGAALQSEGQLIEKLDRAHSELRLAARYMTGPEKHEWKTRCRKMRERRRSR